MCTERESIHARKRRGILVSHVVDVVDIVDVLHVHADALTGAMQILATPRVLGHPGPSYTLV